MKANLETYQKLVSEMFESMSQAIGIHVMVLVLEQALWKTKYNHQDAGKINFSEEGVSLDGLQSIDSEQAVIIAHEFTMGIVATLGRLIGVQLANQLTEELKSNIGEV